MFWEVWRYESFYRACKMYKPNTLSSMCRIHDGRRELISESCPLTSKGVPWYPHMFINVHTHIYTHNNNNNNNNITITTTVIIVKLKQGLKRWLSGEECIPILAKDLYSVPRTYVEWLTTSCNFSCRKIQCPLLDFLGTTLT